MTEREWCEDGFGGATRDDRTTIRFNYGCFGTGIMATVLATKLSSKPVLGADGERLGTVHNVTMNPETGELLSVVVDPKGDLQGFERTTEGRVRLPASSIEGLDDYLIVNPTRETWKGQAD